MDNLTDCRCRFCNKLLGRFDELQLIDNGEKLVLEIKCPRCKTVKRIHKKDDEDGKMKDSYENLFLAIWENALRDDIIKTARGLAEYAFDSVYDTYSLSVDKPLEKKDPQFKEIKKAIKDISQKLAEQLIPKLKEKVYKEAQEWPNNSRKYEDAEYTKIHNRLKKEILNFAEPQMVNITK
jgi:phage FluMu protein Com